MKDQFFRNIIPMVRECIYENQVPIPQWEMAEIPEQKEVAPDLNRLDWKLVTIPLRWGRTKLTCWFRTSITIPEHFKGHEFVLHLDPGAEGLLYVNGTPFHGLDSNRHEIQFHGFNPGDTLELTIEAYNGHQLNPAIFTYVELATINSSARELYHHLDFACKVMDTLAPTTDARAYLMNELYDACKRIDTTGSELRLRDSLDDALACVKETIYARTQQHPEIPQVWLTGHSHIDVAWLWSLFETRRKTARTFSTALRLMEQYPDFIFIQSQPHLYEYAKAHYPAIFDQIKAAVKKGNWEPAGAMWVEADCNISSGEALVRQVVLGKNYFRKEFGVDTKVLWLPDVFGYSWALPQILKKAGVDYFMTAKILWNETNQFPYTTFQWKGIDGSTVLSHFPFMGYSGQVQPGNLKRAVDNIRNKENAQIMLFPFGHGDGGGGVVPEFLENFNRTRYFPELPVCKQGTIADFFEYLDANTENLPTWFGELYYEFHRGTYTTHSKIKRHNRKCDFLYRDAEIFGCLAGESLSDIYQTLEPGWKKILLNQFHDIIPGSSVEEVYLEAEQDYIEARKIGESSRTESIKALAKNIDTITSEGLPVVVFNSLGWQRTELVEIEVSLPTEQVTVTDEAGHHLVHQILDRRHESTKLLFEARDVPPLGYRTFFIRKGTASQLDSDLRVTPSELENRYLKIRLNDGGEIVEMLDKQTGRILNAPGEPINLLKTYQDLPYSWEAWELTPEYQDRELALFKVTEIEVLEHGPARGAIRIKRESEQSTLTQVLALACCHPYLEVHTHVDWHEKRTLLKALFPVDILSTKATYEIQYGSIERPTHRNTSWDAAKFEVCAQKWIDLSEGEYGVSLMNDCKYGHHVSGNVMGITLLKSPMYPHPVHAHSINPHIKDHPYYDNFTDQGEHHFSYAIYPHTGNWRDAGTVEKAYAFNVPLLAGIAEKSSGGLPSRQAFISIDKSNIVLETLKPSEDGKRMVLRLYESHGTKTPGKLKLLIPISEIYECNLIEEPGEKINHTNGEFEIVIKPYEIKSFILSK